MERSEPTEAAPQGLCLDKGYDYASVRDLAAEFGLTLHLRTRGEEAQAIRDEIKHEAGDKARRWVVDRTHPWMNRFRRLGVLWEKKAVNSLALLHLA